MDWEPKVGDAIQLANGRLGAIVGLNKSEDIIWNDGRERKFGEIVYSVAVPILYFAERQEMCLAQ